MPFPFVAELLVGIDDRLEIEGVVVEAVEQTQGTRPVVPIQTPRLPAEFGLTLGQKGNHLFVVHANTFNLWARSTAASWKAQAVLPSQILVLPIGVIVSCRNAGVPLLYADAAPCPPSPFASAVWR